MKLTVALAPMAFLVAALGTGRAGAECCFDCNDDGRVSIAELVTAVQNSTGGCAEPPMSCCGDCDGSQEVLIFELIRAVNTALAGCPVPERFVDNGDGTISDTKTELMWEKKAAQDGYFDFTNPHDADNSYNFAGSCFPGFTFRCQPTAAASTACFAGAIALPISPYPSCSECSVTNGTCNESDTVWAWLVGVNESRFAGYTDWRLPTIDELISTLDYGAPNSPRVDIAFHTPSCDERCIDLTSPDCSCTNPVSSYWSRSFVTSGILRGYVSQIEYHFANETFSLPRNSALVRAVRGGP